MNSKAIKYYVFIVVLGVLNVTPFNEAKAQRINLSIEQSATLENAQVFSLTNLGMDKNGSGPMLISGFLENLTAEEITNLYFDIEISASQVGNIVEFSSDPNYPFSLQPNQSIYVTNNDLAREQIPGIRESLKLTGGLTTEGENFINDLSGSTTLPSDIYTVQVTVFQETDAEGRVNLAQAGTEIGGNFKAGSDEREIYLKAPGNVVGSETNISNNFPQFSWEGDNSTTYRLLVVKDNGIDSPESLLQGAKSSSPTNATDGAGSLLEFEHLDVNIQGTSFQYPSSGAQALERGDTYFWQVVNTVQSNTESEQITSEIWTFTLTGPRGVTDNPPMSQEVVEAIVTIIGQEEFERLQENGFQLASIQYDGQDFTGASATVKLEEILQKIRNEEIIIGDNR
ncbi:hypothetical protein [Gracilimonas sp.]|uniref:hypothetical protein n=1 Tax=Gracilimonas sp. TaxID=1974203 RepID=UPI00287157AA|nr:hypothetical protein [Gracilimonas sp.]